jgi:hypothetical protein
MGHKLPLAQITIFRTPCKVYVEVENGFSLDAESGVEEEKEILHSAAHGETVTSCGRNDVVWLVVDVTCLF